MKYPTKYRRYPFKHKLKRKLRKIAFMVTFAMLVGGGSHYYDKYYNNPHLKKPQNTQINSTK